MEGFRERLDSLIRELAGGKESRFAQMLEIKPENVNKWTNRGSFPSAEQLKNISKKLGININWLLTGEGARNFSPSTAKKDENAKGRKKGEFWGDIEVSLPSVGERLKNIRAKLGYQQVSAAAGVPVSTIKACEAGKQMPDAQYLYWAAGYGYTNATWIMTGENPDDEKLAAEEKARYGQPITPDERELLNLYRDAPKDAQEAAKAVLKVYQKGRKA